MFFRRHAPHIPTFQERLDQLKTLGFAADPDGDAVRVSRNGFAALVGDQPGKLPAVGRIGVLMGNEIGLLVDAGYQKFWETASHKRRPALASELKGLHQFEEDLLEGLGRQVLYNEALGTVNELHMYDRVQGRDAGVK